MTDPKLVCSITVDLVTGLVVVETEVDGKIVSTPVDSVEAALDLATNQLRARFSQSDEAE